MEADGFTYDLFILSMLQGVGCTTSVRSRWNRFVFPCTGLTTDRVGRRLRPLRLASTLLP